jgi:hypothetical protein
MNRFVVWASVALVAVAVCAESSRGQSAGTTGNLVSGGSSGSYGSVLPRRDVRVERRANRQSRRANRQADRAARWGGSSGSTSYGSSGSYGSAGSLGTVAPVAAPPATACPNCIEVQQESTGAKAPDGSAAMCDYRRKFVVS